MPDWSYHVLFKPLLFAMPPGRARDLTLAAMGVISSLPGGGQIIDFLGHMRPARELHVSVLGQSFATPVGLGAGLTTSIDALQALSRFGFGFIELGPVSVRACTTGGQVKRDVQSESILYPDMPECEGIDEFLRKAGRHKLPVATGVRIMHVAGTPAEQAATECSHLMERLDGVVDYFTLDARWVLDEWSSDDWRNCLRSACARESKRRVLLCVPADAIASQLQPILPAIGDCGVDGILVAGGIRQPEHKRMVGAPTRAVTLQAIKCIKDQAPNLVIIGSGGIVQPADAIRMLAAGADLVQMHSGLVYGGPGLPKRTNEALLWWRSNGSSEPDSASTAQTVGGSMTLRELHKQGWLGFALIGVGLIVTAVAAMAVGFVPVILPYDEKFVGLPRASIESINPHLLDFMSHDRVTFAGTTLSTAMMYLLLSWFGIRRGHHWAYAAMRASVMVGFASFLLYLGFRYFDPFHAFVTLALLPFLIWGLMGPPHFIGEQSKNLFNDKRWINSLYGQFWFVCIGAGLILAGVTICKIGISTVFVAEDLMFMHTTAQHIASHSANLIPLIAHDRAGFGGALVTIGIAVLMTALHGFRQGERWVWWMLCLSALPGFIATLGIHFAIGYTNWWHLAPAYIALAMFVAGLWQAYPFLCDRSPPGDKLSG